jgi:hypothetical protein
LDFASADASGRLHTLPAGAAPLYHSAMTTSTIVVLTGADISAESGIATVRRPGGPWEGHRVEEGSTAVDHAAR